MRTIRSIFKWLNLNNSLFSAENNDRYLIFKIEGDVNVKINPFRNINIAKKSNGWFMVET